MQNTPAIKVRVANKYLANHAPEVTGFTQGYLLSVDCRPCDRIRFSCFLESGAIWSGLPIEALWCDRFQPVEGSKSFQTPELQPYTCLEGPFCVYSYDALKSAAMKVISGALKGLCGNYLFSINYQGAGFAECPEQYKTHNIVVLENGQFAALPNNYMQIIEPWFTSEVVALKYKRDVNFYFAGG